MVDAVQSGGYGVLGLYAAQAPVVPETPPQSVPATTNAQPVASVPPVQPAAAVGSGPIPAGEPTADDASTSGRDFSGQRQALAQQATVAVSLAAGETRSSDTTNGASDSAPGNTATGRAFRAYTRGGDGTASVRTGRMLSVSA